MSVAFTFPSGVVKEEVTVSGPNFLPSAESLAAALSVKRKLTGVFSELIT